MSSNPTSPFSRLDTGLIRSTLPTSRDDSRDAPKPEPEQLSAPKPPGTPSKTRRKQVTKPASESASKNASTLAVDEGFQRALRQTLRQPGREVAFARVSLEEKNLLGKVVSAYKERGYRTTENEIQRIALNFLLDNDARHGSEGVLAQLLDAIHKS